MVSWRTFSICGRWRNWKAPTIKRSSNSQVRTPLKPSEELWKAKFSVLFFFFFWFLMLYYSKDHGNRQFVSPIDYYWSECLWFAAFCFKLWFMRFSAVKGFARNRSVSHALFLSLERSNGWQNCKLIPLSSGGFEAKKARQGKMIINQRCFPYLIFLEHRKIPAKITDPPQNCGNCACTRKTVKSSGIRIPPAGCVPPSMWAIMFTSVHVLCYSWEHFFMRSNSRSLFLGSRASCRAKQTLSHLPIIRPTSFV